MIFGHLRQPCRQTTLYDTFSSYNRVTSVSLSLTALTIRENSNGRTDINWERNRNFTFCKPVGIARSYPLIELSTWKQLIYAILLYVGFNKVKIDLDIQISMDGSRGNDNVGESINISAHICIRKNSMYTRMHRRGQSVRK